jgi:hypothetical protein
LRIWWPRLELWSPLPRSSWWWGRGSAAAFSRLATASAVGERERFSSEVHHGAVVIFFHGRRVTPPTSSGGDGCFHSLSLGLQQPPCVPASADALLLCRSWLPPPCPKWSCPRRCEGWLQRTLVWWRRS